MSTSKWTDEDLQEFIDCIESDNAKELGQWLKAFQISPSQDVRILPYLEKLLTSQSVCIVYNSEPLYYGEIRLLAAQALAAERAKLNIDEPVYCKLVVPLVDNEVDTYASEIGIKVRYRIEDTIEALERLIELNRVPLMEVRYDPADFRQAFAIQEAPLEPEADEEE